MAERQNRSSLRNAFRAAVCAAVFASATLTVSRPAEAQTERTELVVYTAVPVRELARYKAAFEAQHKDIAIRWVRDATDRITARLFAERHAPAADVVWGLAATSVALLAEEDYFEPYAPKGLNALDPRLRDPRDPPRWVGLRAWIGALCVNRERMAALGLPMPRSWMDLLAPALRGRIVMPDPRATRTGYLAVTAWMRIWGEARAWKYMDRLHENVAVYTRSGAWPCRLAARGEIAVGLSYAYKGLRLLAEEAPIAVIAPVEGVGWDVEAAAIVRGTAKAKAARVYVDWSIGPAATRLHARRYGVYAESGRVPPARPLPAEIVQRMISPDFAWAAANRERILDRWQRRYGIKAEPAGP